MTRWLILLAACDGSAPNVLDAHAIDARPVDAHVDAAPPPDVADNLACLFQPPASAAPDPFTLDGRVYAIDHYQIAGIAGATVELRHKADDHVIATSTVSDADGNYALAAPTGGDAIDGYFAITAPGMVPTRLDEGDAIAPGYFSLALLASSDEIQRWYADAGATYTADAATVIAIAVDCNHASLPGATLTTSTPSVYYDGGRWDPTATASDKGYALVPNAKPATVVEPGAGGPKFPNHIFASPSGMLTLAVASPYVQP